jgi:lipopolysaccharide transport system ATP-binding protein
MQDVSHDQGRTILFVSHNMGAIRTLCLKTLILQSGGITLLANTEEAINKYLSLMNNNSLEYQSEKTTDLYIAHARLLNREMITTNLYDFGEKPKCEIVIKTNLSTLKGIFFTIALQNKFKNRVFSSDHSLEELKKKDSREIRLVFEFPNLPYAPGLYFLIMGIHKPNIQSIEILDDLLPFEIIDKGSILSKYKAFTGDMLIEGRIIPK